MEPSHQALNRPLAKELVFEFLTGLYLLAVVVLCWRHPALTTALLVVGAGIQLWFWREKADVAMMVAAAVLGTPSEMVSVKLNVWTYYAPGLVFGIPVWIPLVWANLFCLYRRASLTGLALAREKWPKDGFPSIRDCSWVLGVVVLLYAFVTLAVIRRAIAIVYGVFMIPTLLCWHKERDILIFCIGAVLGTVGEYLCMRLGFWVYHYPYFESIGLPISLPLAWGLSAIITSRIASLWERRPETKGE